jgi:hypothetical protein
MGPVQRLDGCRRLHGSRVGTRIPAGDVAVSGRNATATTLFIAFTGFAFSTQMYAFLGLHYLVHQLGLRETVVFSQLVTFRGLEGRSVQKRDSQPAVSPRPASSAGGDDAEPAVR